jgi:putative DNA primase/helicase
MLDLSGEPHVVATYNYVDAYGTLRYQVQRWHPKDFRCVPGLPEPAHRVLYNLPAITWARENDKTLYIVEGEKDCDRLATLGIPATCNVGGAGIGKWLPQYTETVAGLHVIIVADDDEPGREHAREIAHAIRDRVATLRLTYCRRGNDISAALDAGYQLDAALEDLPTTEGIGIFRVSDIVTSRVEWAWPGYIPRGKISIIDGDPGEGKSVLSLDLAARWSTGAKMPDGTQGIGPVDVILVLAEDDPADTVKPRLIAAGADLNRVHVVVSGADRKHPFEFETGLPAVEAKMTEIPAAVVIFDPVMAFMSARTDSNNDASVRRAIWPVKMFAQDNDAAVILVRHLNKSGGVKVMYRGGGSIGFIGSARAGYLVTRSPDDDAMRLFAPTKNNLAPMPPTLSYAVETSPAGLPYLVWHGSVDITAQVALDRIEAPTPPADDVSTDVPNDFVMGRRVRQMERAFLSDTMAAGPLSWAEILAAGREHGFTEASLRRARTDLGMRLQKITDPATGNAGTKWAMVEPGTPTAPTPSTAVPGRAVDDVDDDVLQREADLMAAPLQCSICDTGERVSRYGKPYWLVRCRSHDPRRYAG